MSSTRRYDIEIEGKTCQHCGKKVNRIIIERKSYVFLRPSFNIDYCCFKCYKILWADKKDD